MLRRGPKDREKSEIKVPTDKYKRLLLMQYDLIDAYYMCVGREGCQKCFHTNNNIKSKEKIDIDIVISGL